MRTYKALKQRNLFRQMLSTPIRILSRFRNFYIKSLVDCSGAAGYGGGVTAPVSVLPKSFSVNSSSTNNYRQDQHVFSRWHFSRTSSKMNNDVEKNDLGFQRKVQVQSSMELNYGMRMRSYSVGLGKIGKIDEERPCSFREEDHEVHSSADLYLRSRSYAVNRTSRY